MSFAVGDVDLGPSFDVYEALDELGKAGYEFAFDVLAAEGEEMPAGPHEAAAKLLGSKPDVSPGAMTVLRLLAGAPSEETHRDTE